MAGVQFSLEDASRIIKAVQWAETLMRNPGPPQRAAAPAPQSPDLQIVRVTSTTQTAGRYPGKVELVDSSTAPPTLTDLGDVWVVESAGGTLAAGNYLARRAGDQNGRPVFGVMLGAVGGGPLGAGLEVKAVSGSPDYTGVSVLLVDAAAGFSLTQPAAGQAQVSQTAADNTHVGYVSLSDQVLGAGAKTVHGLVSISYVNWDDGAGNVWTSFSSGSILNIEAPNSQGYGVLLAAAGSWTVLNSPNFVFWSAGTIMAGSRFAIGRTSIGSGSILGQTGTSGGGDTVTGGIITTLGSGGVTTNVTTITGGTDNTLLYQSAGKVAEAAVGVGLAIAGGALGFAGAALKGLAKGAN